MGNYSASWLVDFYHSWPHLSFSFTVLKPEDYGFDNNAYLESLAMIALMVIIWLLLTMVIFAIYFCCLKAKGKADAKYNSNGCYCSVCILTVFLMLNLGAVGVALYGNMQTGDGLKVAAASVHTGNHTFYVLNTQVLNLQFLSGEFMVLVENLKTSRPDDPDVLSMEETSHKTSDAIDPFAVHLSGIEDRLAWSIEILVVSEQYRSLITFCLLGFQCLVCFLGLVGLCCRSKCTLITTIVLGMICITATYFYLAVDLMINVAASDYCMDPYIQLYNQTVEKGYLTGESADYFLKCESQEGNPFVPYMENGRALLKQSNLSVEAVRTKENITEQEQELLLEIDAYTDEVSKILDTLEAKLDCEPTKTALHQFIPAVCGTMVEGLFALTTAMLGIGLCLSVALCAAAKTGKRYGKHLYGTDSVTDLDFHDPFLPRPTRFHNRSSNITRTNNPIYATTASSNSNYGVASNTLSFFREGSDEDVSLIENPPPYSPPRPTSRLSQ